MIRTALRLSTVAALTNGGIEPYPTMAGNGVFDSRNDPIDELVGETRFPVIIVRTDQDRTEYRTPSGAPNTAPGPRDVIMTIESSVMDAKVGEDGKIVLHWAMTDASLEAFLDLMEMQIDNALFGWGPWSDWWHFLWPRVESVSQPLFSVPESGRVRKAIREMTLTMRVPSECLPKPIAEDDLPRDEDSGELIRDVVVTLPPRIRQVFDKIETDGGGDLKTYAAELRAQLEAQRLPRSSIYPMFHTFDQKIVDAAD